MNFIIVYKIDNNKIHRFFFEITQRKYEHNSDCMNWFRILKPEYDLIIYSDMSDMLSSISFCK